MPDFAVFQPLGTLRWIEEPFPVYKGLAMATDRT